MVSRHEFEEYRRAARRGHAHFICRLGDCYKSGDGVRRNDKKATGLYRRAAQKGHSDDCYKTGVGVKRDDEEAVSFYQKAVQQGHFMALHNLAMCFYNGEGVEKNDRTAFLLIQVAARRGNPDARFYLAMFYVSRPRLNWISTGTCPSAASSWYELSSRHPG